jgi:hypothetical protein
VAASCWIKNYHDHRPLYFPAECSDYRRLRVRLDLKGVTQLKTRIYAVTDPLLPDAKPRLVEAASASAAIRFVVAGKYEANVVGTLELAKLFKAGVAVEGGTNA